MRDGGVNKFSRGLGGPSRRPSSHDFPRHCTLASPRQPESLPVIVLKYVACLSHAPFKIYIYMYTDPNLEHLPVRSGRTGTGLGALRGLAGFHVGVGHLLSVCCLTYQFLAHIYI